MKIVEEFSLNVFIKHSGSVEKGFSARSYDAFPWIQYFPKLYDRHREN
jgi:hypothetical protein